MDVRIFCTYVCRKYIDSVFHGAALSTATILGITSPICQEEAHLTNVPKFIYLLSRMYNVSIFSCAHLTMI
jgi:hypothetical protein